MKLRNLLLLLLLALPVSAIAFGQSDHPEIPDTPDAWETVGEGIEFQKYHLTSPVPVNVFVARMDRNNPNTAIESSIGQGRLSRGRETVGNMSDRYDGALNYWGPPTIPVTPTWGSTNDVVVAINGYYFDYETGIPQRGQVHSGWYAKRFDDNHNGSGFIWKMDRSAFIGACITHPDNKQYVHVDSETQILIDGVNTSRDDDELILYTPQYDRDTETDNSGTEVLVEMMAPTYISIASNMPVGIVRQIRQNQGSTPIPYDHVVLSAHGLKAQELEANLQTGQHIGIAQRVVDCPAEPVVNDWTKAYAGIGGHWRFLRNEVIFPYSDDSQATVRDPRTAIAYNDDYIFFIVVDGRNPGVSEGMKIAELAEFAKDTLGATYGISQDGGGSSTMAINGEVVNNTYCNFTKCEPGELYLKVYLPLVTTYDNNNLNRTPRSQPELQAEWDDEAQILQALVANGMMMVVVQPMDKSTLPLDPGDPITTTETVNVYLGPGTNYAVLNSADGEGTILAPLNELGGVYAKNHYWWKVDFGGNVKGWVFEDYLIPQLKLRKTDGFKAR